MAAPAGRLFVQRLKAGLPGLIPVRWSRYNPAFLNPVTDKEKYQRPLEEFNKEEKEDWDFKATRPIKACPPSLSSCIYYDETVSKFTNMMMKGGDKILSRSIMNKTLEKIKRTQLEKYYSASPDERESIECNPYTVFHQAINNCQPIIGLTSVLKGGKSYQVPTPLTENRRRFLAMKWIITACRDKKISRIRMYEKLADIILESFKGEGNIVKKKNELHKMAESNRAYAHFRWW
ncbi:PREDICTED: 28S ribosomal protein S7, mitochondrial [Nanorana parkeri]|uniref:28S ribosomal protein S7, mitochondrial n=1 Tax=Nanorana parkeri TaxID=125878 RepID=UPI000854B211|nr:PREDICTED: 28S ribosomal protein S7, mitochondrial [Nanorana parkeri]